MNFNDKLNKTIEKNNSLVCVGLDPELEKIPKSLGRNKNSIFEFNKKIIDSTHDLVCAYKPNSAFYEAYGIEGMNFLKQTVDYIHNSYPDIPIVLDAKRADIGNTAKMYAKAMFEVLNADAVTVYPNLGLDSLVPFFEYKDKLTILLIKTSNPDSGMFQNLPTDGKPYYLRMCEIIKTWNYKTFGIFVGATYPEDLKKVREFFPDRIFLSAGIGAQNAEIENAIKAGINSQKSGIMFNVSRSILYASQDENFAEIARKKTQEVKNTINKYRT